MSFSPSARPQQAYGSLPDGPKSQLTLDRGFLDVPCLQTDLPPSRRASSPRKGRGANEESGETRTKSVPSGCQTLRAAGSIRHHWFDIAVSVCLPSTHETEVGQRASYLTQRLIDGYCQMKTRDTRSLEKQRFRDRRATTLNSLPPEVAALIGQPVEGKAKVKTPSADTITAFYQSWDWKRLRMLVLLKQGRRCQCCGATPADGVRLVVDHIKPLRKHWKLRLERDNLQVLCSDCNMGKGSHIEKDFR